MARSLLTEINYKTWQGKKTELMKVGKPCRWRVRLLPCLKVEANHGCMYLVAMINLLAHHLPEMFSGIQGWSFGQFWLLWVSHPPPSQFLFFTLPHHIAIFKMYFKKNQQISNMHLCVCTCVCTRHFSTIRLFAKCLSLIRCIFVCQCMHLLCTLPPNICILVHMAGKLPYKNGRSGNF